MGAWERASSHFEAALAMSRRTEAWPFLAETQRDFAAALLTRGRSEDGPPARALLRDALAGAERLGMPAAAAGARRLLG